ncbi:PPH22, partial [Symbiodinium pilosum]
MEAQSQLLARLFAAGKLTLEECKQACAAAARHFRREENIIVVTAPVVVVGSLRGQLRDLLAIFQMCGPVPETSYLFLGDYTSSGPDPCDTIALLLLLKARFPSKVTLLRGKGEQRQMTQVYGLHDDCMRQFHSGGAEVWEAFCDCFDHMPLAAVVNEKILCVHSGFSPELEDLQELRDLDRHRDYGHEGPMADMLWSDPEDRTGWNIAPKSVGYSFGEDITADFLQANKLSLLIRSKQLCIDGYA